VHGTDRFSGRHPIHEVTTNTDVLTDALISNTSRSAVRAAGEASSTTFKDNVRELVTNGITTYAEARKTVLNV
jgi:type II secretory ATPase GspE/PulE/Tfp pilus assembly ATPase PilB-like protein